MSDIARQFESADALRLRVRDFFDEVPGSVGTAVVDQEDVVVGRDSFRLFQLVDVAEQTRKRVLNARLFVVTRDHERNGRRFGGGHGQWVGCTELRTDVAQARYESVLSQRLQSFTKRPLGNIGFKCRPVHA
ncbi:MAG: hypothetical protein WBW11_08775 [Pseudolabrys sp.]|jgi:hypothetical protein